MSDEIKNNSNTGYYGMKVSLMDVHLQVHAVPTLWRGMLERPSSSSVNIEKNTPKQKNTFVRAITAILNSTQITTD